MKQIELTQGYAVTVDDEDYDELVVHNWCAMVASDRDEKVVAGRSLNPGIEYLHHRILPKRYDLYVDHKDRNPMNCTRSNLRYATHGQNRANSKLNSNNSTGFRGVSFQVTRTGNVRYKAYIGTYPKRHLGTYDTAEEAASAYDNAAREQYGEFAVLNLPSKGGQ